MCKAGKVGASTKAGSPRSPAGMQTCTCGTRGTSQFWRGSCASPCPVGFFFWWHMSLTFFTFLLIRVALELRMIEVFLNPDFFVLLFFLVQSTQQSTQKKMISQCLLLKSISAKLSEGAFALARFFINFFFFR
jgi:hypothetical protein